MKLGILVFDVGMFECPLDKAVRSFSGVPDAYDVSACTAPAPRTVRDSEQEKEYPYPTRVTEAADSSIGGQALPVDSRGTRGARSS